MKFLKLTGDRDRDLVKRQWPFLSVTEKAKYILSYYGTAFLFALALLAGIAFFTKDYRAKKPEAAFYVMAIDCETAEESVNEIQEKLAARLNIDEDENCVLVETGYSVSSGAQAEATIFAYMQSGRVDLVIAPEEIFNKYAVTGYLAPLTDVEYEDILDSRESEDLFYASLVDYSNGGAVHELPFAPHDSSGECYGVYLDGLMFGGYVAGVMANAPDQDKVAEGLSCIING